MVDINDCIKIGEKYYLVKDVHSVLDARIKDISIEEIDGI